MAAWGSGNRYSDQTTRNAANLVLQLNFGNEHDQVYQQLINPKKGEAGPFEYDAHPINNAGKNTLAWVRMDVNFETNEVLIEEVQMDWLRYVERSFKRIQLGRSRNPKMKLSDIWDGINGRYNDYQQYVERIINSYKKIWDEAALTAAIHFIRSELGIRNIYYHTYDTGRKIKAAGMPPRSIYTSLPKRFGFELTPHAPVMVQHDKFARRVLKKINNPLWYRLDE